VWNGNFSIQITDQDISAKVVEAFSFSNHTVLAIDLSEGIPEAQIAAEVVELVRDLRQSCGIGTENRGKESVGRKRKLSDELISKMRREWNEGKTGVEITIEHWDQLASEGDREYSPEDLGADIKMTSAYKTAQRYLKQH
jgi:hypothetical protein